jgi:hypothetical protein
MKITLLGGRTLVLNAAQVAFIVIAALTALNGFVDSLNFEFVDPSNANICTFLALPPDAYGDTIKASFVAPPFTPPDTSHWPPYITFYCLHNNPYVRQDLQAHPQVTGLSFLHVTPVTLMMHLLIKRVMLAVSPQFVIELFFIAALTGLAAVCFVMAPTRVCSAGVLLVLALSYPFLMILCRANMGALVGAIALPFYVYFILRKPRLGAAVVCLTMAALFRPNVVLLCPVLLCLGFRRAVVGSGAAALSLAVIAALFYYLDGLLYPGYGLATQLSALKAYTGTYIVGINGDQFNNSAFGAVKTIICIFHGRDCRDIAGLLQKINLTLAVIFVGFLLAGAGLYLLRRISDFAFAFLTFSCLALATTIFGVYHLFAFAVFPLLLLHARADKPLEAQDRLILAICVFVLVPKDYVFIHDISLETILNPLALIAALVSVMAQGLAGPPSEEAFSARELTEPQTA